jgi:glutathione S-transferase
MVGRQSILGNPPKESSMAGVYRIFGSELSPYSVKVRSYFRYKGLPHEWIVRSSDNQAEYDRYAKLPLIPLVISPEGTALQDSTPIIEHFEQRFPEPSIHPTDPAMQFLSAMLEEYGDEWGNKPMFHYRWFYEADQQSAGRRIAQGMMPNLPEDSLGGAVDMILGRMVPRLKLVGSSQETKEQIEASFHRQLGLLNSHLAGRQYLFGSRPAFGDFGLYAQLYECSTDPTPGAIIRAKAPQVLSWIERMLDPRNEGEFEGWSSLEATLLPLLRKEVGGVFFPWSAANAEALAAGAKEFSLQIEGKPFAQETQKYHAKSLRALRQRYAEVSDKTNLDSILQEAGCLSWLQAQ